MLHRARYGIVQTCQEIVVISWIEPQKIKLTLVIYLLIMA